MIGLLQPAHIKGVIISPLRLFGLFFLLGDPTDSGKVTASSKSLKRVDRHTGV